MAGRVRLQAAAARGAEPALGRVDDAQQPLLVVGVDDDREVGERVADLGALVELGPADDLVGDGVAAELLLEHAALGVGAVEHGDLARAVRTPVGCRLAGQQRCTSLATNCASARSSLTSTTCTASPSPRPVHRFLPLRSRLLVTTALATSRIGCVSGSSAPAG